MARAFIAMAMIALLLCWNYRASADASPGDLDPNFGSGGKIVTDFEGATLPVIAYGLAVQPDGKIVVAGGSGRDFMLARYNPEGNLDSSFGTGGKVTTEVGQDLPFWDHKVRVLPGGRILVMGERIFLGGYSLVCYNADGSLDTSFGHAGMLVERFLDSYDANIAVQADGRILLAGGLENGFGFVRFNPDGTLDATFGTGGKVAIKVPGLNSSASSVTLQSDGRIVAAGSSWKPNQGSSSRITLVRLGSDGSLDPTFGTGGVVREGLYGDRYEKAGHVVVALDGRIVVAGQSITRNLYNPDLTLVRYTADGSLDTSFGDGGKVATDLGGMDLPSELVLQPDGRIVIAMGEGFELIRYNSDGSLDLSFGSNGVVSTDFIEGDPQVQAEVTALALAGEDRLVAAGYRYKRPPSINISGFVLACYMTTGVTKGEDFDLRFSQPAINVNRGKKATVTVRVDRFGGFTGEVTVRPPDLSAERIICTSPDPKTTSGREANWKFKVKARAEPGPHQLTFVGRDATGRERVATVTLLVE
jgi:uncharacterized delta-60 repeat protein